jgi:cephalosporin hydroxylase
VKLVIDTDASTLLVNEADSEREHSLYSPEAFALLSRAWTKVGWALKYSYGFTWMGRPIVQLPEDLIRIQETIYRLRPDVVVETGVAHGGSLVFYASLLRAMGHGRVVGVDIEIRPHNRRAIEEHELGATIELIEGSSVDPEVVERVRAAIGSSARVLVILDSNHTKPHVAAELKAYAPMVSVGSYVIATDGVMEDLGDVPGGRLEWREDNPAAAAREFAVSNPSFVLEAPPFLFRQALTDVQVTYWPSAYLRRVSAP